LINIFNKELLLVNKAHPQIKEMENKTNLNSNSLQ